MDQCMPMFSRMKSKLRYSGRFKPKKESEQVTQQGLGNSLLSTSWEGGLSQPQSYNQNQETEDTSGSYIALPDGWHEDYDDETGQPGYINDSTGAKWFTSCDSEGRIYFFEENSSESSWTLPACDVVKPTKRTSEQRLEGDLDKEPGVKRRLESNSAGEKFPNNWLQFLNENICVLREATLNYTKITENGKKLRKKWVPGHVVLTELSLLFFKDAETFATIKNVRESSLAARPEFSIDLKDALLEHGQKASSRPNVFLVSTNLGVEVLVQCETGTQAKAWYQAIHKSISKTS